MSDVLDPIMQAMKAKIVATGDFSPDQVTISLSGQPSLIAVSDYYITLTPMLGSQLEGQVYGAGRYASGFRNTVRVTLYTRSALDRIYLNSSGLTDAALGLLVNMQLVLNSLQLFLPVVDDVALVEEPMRALSQSMPANYSKSPEWCFCTLDFEVVTAWAINPMNP